VVEHPVPEVPDEGATRARLTSAPGTVVGRFAAASNATLLVALHDPDGTVPEVDPEEGIDGLDPTRFAVYKPELGEAPLWDFPDGTLWRREVAACVVDRAIGLGMVPLTVRRDDLEHGAGSLQQLIPFDPAEHYFELRERPELLSQLRRMVLFDILLDNADRKGGHLLLDTSVEAPHIRLIDHGVCFHAEPHLRTVAWDFAREAVRSDERALGERLGALLDAGDDAITELHDLLSPVEVERLRERAHVVAMLRQFPRPAHDRQFPWPLL
jgi:uncharacterized repeat protein (TIGR03843 family)